MRLSSCKASAAFFALAARAIAVAGSDEKLEVCRKLGAEHLINRNTQDIVEEVLQSNGLEKVAHAYHTYRQKRAEIREAKWWLLNFEIKTKLSPYFSVLEVKIHYFSLGRSWRKLFRATSS